MFDKQKFSKIIKQINDSYHTQHDFADYSGVNRTYLSQYINMKLDNPPKPKILEKIAKSSKGITTYDELMQICGYTNYMIDFFFDDSIKQNGNKIPIVYDIYFDNNSRKFIADSDNQYIIANFKMEENKEYFAYKVKDNSMLPLLKKDDLAIISKTSQLSSNKIFLIYYNNEILIKKILAFEDHIELCSDLFGYSQPITISKTELSNTNFEIIGLVEKAEINLK